MIHLKTLDILDAILLLLSTTPIVSIIKDEDQLLEKSFMGSWIP